jgi:mono/diheme cytochrome c family protein
MPCRWALTAVGLALSMAPIGSAAEQVDFNREVRPILAGNCFACHGPDDKKREADLRLDLRDSATADRGGTRAIVAGDPKSSGLIRRISSRDPDERMPPASTGKTLAPREIETLGRWIEQGAKYAPHWSYVKPVRPPLPQVGDRSWTKNEIDFFVLARLEREGLRPSPEADRWSLIRRAALDVTGLAPSIEEVDQFVADGSPNAYERLVDRLLTKETYGEHWARTWLDLARYADSAGYVADRPREIWAYRDYVIRALNANKPFDLFTIEQIAGDLLPNPTEEQLVATAFHRNTPTNDEGGTDDEEFRNVAVVDRVNTTMAAWMGTTMGCAQCHNHKYDPITQKEYFQVFAFFNNTEDTDNPDERPMYSFFTGAQKQERARWESEVAGLEKGAASKPLTAEQAKRLAELKARLAAMKPVAVPIMRELPQGKRRTTTIQNRGNFLDRGPQVAEGVPAALHPLPKDAARDRLTLARWLVDENNPLTARVTANRLWEKVFGIGLVATADDFGAQGEAPSHPELLDWLATELVAKRWDVKHLVRLLVTSAAYRQSSRVTPELLQRDPDNRLLARGPRFRLDAEGIRDQALLAGGLLSRKMYGPPVRPLQPSFGLSAAFGGAMDWQTSEGEDRYRRGVYVTWRRTNPYPSMSTFDAPDRETCTARRPRTNTPLQALVTLNDPVYVEAAQALARRLVREGGASAAERARYGFRLCAARPPSEIELKALVGLHHGAYERFSKEPEQARKMAAVPLGPPPQGADVADLAAWTVVGNVLLNMDETLMSR